MTGKHPSPRGSARHLRGEATHLDHVCTETSLKSRERAEMRRAAAICRQRSWARLYRCRRGRTEPEDPSQDGFSSASEEKSDSMRVQWHAGLHPAFWGGHPL